MQNEVPIYLFTGFLESGKTKFIQETLEDERFSNGESTLLLVCEEGTEEYDLSKCPGNATVIRFVEDESDFTKEYLLKLEDEIGFSRVVLEYNGMWQKKTLFDNLPEHWIIYQEMLFVDSTTFMAYNSNMRSLVADKLMTCELCVFNRFRDEYDKNEFHKIVRALNRRCDICYEYTDGKIEYDDIPDPLPFDINAPIIEIKDEDYAEWYRDTGENIDNYNGKTVRFKGLVRKNARLPEGTFVVGRDVMTCCIEDTKFAGFVCQSALKKEVGNNDWIVLTAKIEVKFSKIYNRVGPVLQAEKIEISDPPKSVIATFY